jgi:hypothetical protein
MANSHNTSGTQMTKAHAAIEPLVPGSQIEVQLSGGGTREGCYNELRQTEVVIDHQGIALSEVTAVFHVTSQAHE